MVELVDGAIELARKFGHIGWLGQFLTHRLGTLIAIGDWDRAEVDSSEQFEYAQIIQLGFASAYRAQLLALRGDPSSSRAALADAMAALQSIDTVPQRAGLEVEITLTLLLLGDAAESLRRIETAPQGGSQDMFLAATAAKAAGHLGNQAALKDVAEKVSALRASAFALAVRLHLQSAAAAAAGRWDEANAIYPNAISAYQALEFNLDAGLVGLEYAAYLEDRYDEARAAGAKAAAWFSERGGAGVVERYRAAFKGTPAQPASRAGASTTAVPVDAEQPA
jgi:tetratricopeptide (TPR) repeat protein